MLKKIVFAAVLAAGIAAPLAVDGAQAAGFTCAYKEAPNAPKNLPPIKGLEEDMTQVQAGGQLAALVRDFVAAKIPPALIVDHLVWSYCPLVANDNGLSVAQKTDRLRRFAGQVAALVYTPPGADELAILVDLPLAPSLLSRVDEAARAAGISRDEWMKRAIATALATP